MDLIEVLWKQDVDMGFSLEDPVQPEGPQATKVELQDEIAKELKLAEEKIQKKIEETEKIEKVKASLLDPDSKEDDPWAGLSYTVDTETESWCLRVLLRVLFKLITFIHEENSGRARFNIARNVPARPVKYHDHTEDRRQVEAIPTTD
ncbi:hypothetical protein RR46_07039 [Papilio xuthus]|uniref:Uncharacterized protein n=1 Tax=Papilio xuthus TaxID=66420 RepID=A0A194Q513_PAPXU|nr:hypothetical protein RR46_07039 [Papilio xuthus]